MASWTRGIIGLWVMLSPWLLGFSQITIAKWSNILLGLVLVLMSAWELKGHLNQ